MPAPSWAEVGSPRYLSAAQKPDGRFSLFGLNKTAEIVFEVPLPSRGHAAAVHPSRPEAVAFARRPGTYAIVIDCRDGTPVAELRTQPGRHFYGHGVFSADGLRLYTTENDYEHAVGMIGIWDARAGYKRVGEVFSGGVGPHDIRRLPDGRTLVVANGGIETHPDTGRTKLNIPVMRPNLAFMSMDGRLEDRIELDVSLNKNSIRHLAISESGLVAFAMQWQGDASDLVPLIGLRDPEGRVSLLERDAGHQAMMLGYAGSIAFDQSGQRIAVTSPRGGRVQAFQVDEGVPDLSVGKADVCGIAPAEAGFAVTSGDGSIAIGLGSGLRMDVRADCRWDNHLVVV